MSITAEAFAAVDPDAERRTEVWDGEGVLSALAGWDHQNIVGVLCAAFYAVLGEAGRGLVFPGVNVSDRADDWRGNYRCPDVAVYLSTNPAVFHEAHVQGGPDLAVEVVSPGEDPHAKVPFYAAVGTRELLIVTRSGGWSLELVRLAAGGLVAAGTTTPGGPPLACQGVGVTVALASGRARPEVVVAHPPSGREWRA